MFTALWWVFPYRCTAYQHLATRTEVFCFSWAYTRNENHQNVSRIRKFFPSSSWEHLWHYNQPSSSCNNTIILQLRLHVLYHIWSHVWEILLRIIGGVPWDLDMKMVAFTVFFFFFYKSPVFFLLTQVLSSPTDTVLMLVTYHRNFCSHHGHHLCRGKIGDMMAFPLSQLRAQSSPTSPSVCTPARVCDYGGNVSHEEYVSLWH